MKLEIVRPRLQAPVTYAPTFLADHESMFSSLWEELDWVDVAGNRREYYCSAMGTPYTYGAGAGVRTYDPQPYHPTILEIQWRLEVLTETSFEVCFLNGYRDGKDQLGWHADDSPEMDDARPIAIVSLGAKREIYFREKLEDGFGPIERLWLEPGSLCLMHPGMQDTHQHRIPKASYDCGPRISLTFRGYAPIA